MAFIHLHVHSYYSRNKGLATPSALAAMAVEKEMPCLALTDQDTLSGMAEFIQACRQHGVKPIVGAELSVLFPVVNQTAQSIHHLTVLVESEVGYRNLVSLLNLRNRQKTAKAPPAIPLADLEANIRGLIVLSGCHVSRLFHVAQQKRLDEAVGHVQSLIRAAGREHVFMEILPPANSFDEKINRRLLELAAYTNIAAVATQNIYYLKKSDHLGQYILSTSQPADETWNEWLQQHRLRHFCGEEEMRAQFGWREDLLENTEKIASMCRFAIPSNAQHFPVHALPKGNDPEVALWEKSVQGLSKIASGPAEVALKERLNREIAQIRQARLAPYFLLLHEVAAELDNAGIVRGPAQGIWQTSATAAALGLALLDPAAFHLPEPNWLEQVERYPLYRFEVAESNQARAAEIMTGRVGRYMVARVGRWSSTKRQALLKQLAEQVGMSGARMSRLLAERPRPVIKKKAGRHTNGNGNGHSLEEGLKVDDSAFLRKAADLLADRPAALRPDGVMLAFSGQDIEDTVPLVELTESGLTTALDAHSLDVLGVPKVDIVSSSLMTVISWTVQTIREQSDAAFNLKSIPLNDQETYALLGQGKTNCIGELHSISAKVMLRSTPPKSLIELAALLRKRRKGDIVAADLATADLTPVLPAALACYWAAWLKVHYPLAFFSAMLTRYLSNPRRFPILLREARRDKIVIHPPDITLSRFHFSPEKNAIRSGLVVVRQLGERAYEELKEERKARPFDELVDFCRRTDAKTFTNRLVSNLIKSGAMDSFDLPRSHQLATLDDILRDVKAERDHTDDLEQPTLFDLDQLEFKRPGSDVRLDEVPEFDLEQLLAYEREATGQVISLDPFKLFQPLVKHLKARGPFDLRRKDAGQMIYVAGYIDHVEWDENLAGDAAVALIDCEGSVIRVARGARSFIGPELECTGPALLYGIVRKNKEETYLEAVEIHSLDEIYRMSRRVERMIVDVQGMDRRAMKDLIATAKSCSGNTEIVVAVNAFEAAPGSNKLDGLTTLFCPPIFEKFVQVLGKDRISLEDAEGEIVSPRLPAIIA